jgi:iron complex transport system ATP-binding protein
LKLKIQNVSFHYESVKALESVTFEVQSGEVLGVIGPNGSGKTTLLKCINMILKPESGTVFIDEKDISGLSRKDIAHRIGLVPQHSHVSFPFTVLDVVLMGRMPHLGRFMGKETQRDLEIVEKAMELTNTYHLANRLIDELSGGEFQRVIIARALAQEPNLLLLDEPTLHLDISHQLEIMELIRELAKNRELTAIVVSHDLNLAARFCDRLLLLNSGKIYAIGHPKEVLSPEKIREVYHINVKIGYHPENRSPNIIPLTSLDRE